MITLTSSAFVGKAINQVADSYERHARLYPALLALSPLFALITVLYHRDMGLIGTLASMLVFCGMLYFLSDMARTLGKEKETLLWSQWGGMPSMQLLRYSDKTFDEISKKRYHDTLGKLLGVPLPSASDEEAAPDKADGFYRSASAKLREATRDTKKFHLLFVDNVAYGFRRNALGLKPWAIVICLLVLIWLALSLGVYSWISTVHSIQDLRSRMSGPVLLVLLATVAMLFIWIFYFTKRTTRSAAFSYAQKLIEACDSLDKPSQTKPRSRAKKGDIGAG